MVTMYQRSVFVVTTGALLGCGVDGPASTTFEDEAAGTVPECDAVSVPTPPALAETAPCEDEGLLVPAAGGAE